MPLVSVVMSVYNGENYQAEAIDSILTQTFTDFELIIVDDGSQDGTTDIIRAYQQRDERIQYIPIESNRGMGDARNCGFFAAKGKYLTIMDCDDISLPERLAKQVDFLDTHPEIGAVGVSARLVNHDLSETLIDFDLPRRHCEIVFDMFARIGFVYATVMTRRKFLTAVGGNEPGRRTAADRELFARMLWETSIRYANLPEVLYLYRRHSDSMSQTRTGTLVQESLDPQARMLDRLWQEAPNDTLDRFLRLRLGQKLNWLERRVARRDLQRLIDSLISAKWVDSQDLPLLLASMRLRLEEASPRLWQMYCHWRRHHFGGR